MFENWGGPESRKRTSGPNHEREHLSAMAEIKLKKSILSIRGLTDQLTPLTGRTVHQVLNTSDELLQRGRAIQVGIDTHQLIVVMFIRVLVRTGIVRVIHTRSQIGIVEILVLMIQSQRMANLLARHQVPPCGRVVGRSVEVSVV